MKKIKSVLSYIVQLIFNPIRKIGSIPITDRFIDFVSKHVWLRLLVSLLLAVAISVYYYYIK